LRVGLLDPSTVEKVLTGIAQAMLGYDGPASCDPVFVAITRCADFHITLDTG